MKSEHRHELQTNELGKVTEKVGTFLEVHGNRLMIAICVASLVGSGIIWWVKSERASDAAAWRELWTAISKNNPDDFKDVWNAYPGTTTALWARVHEGEARLALGVPKLFDNVEAGTTELTKAREAFQAVVDKRGALPDAREQALFGLGRALESLSDTSGAIKYYEMLISEFPTSLYKEDAEERINVLEKGSGQEFYTWFSSYPRPKVKDKLPRDHVGTDEDDEGPNLGEKMRDRKSDVEAGGLKPSDDAESPKLPGSDPPNGDEPGDAGTDSKSKPGESKPGESKPDRDQKSPPDSQSDEP